MRKSLKSKFVYIAFAALLLSIAACGNKKSNMPADSKAAQPQDSVMIVEEETVVVAIDSIAPDTTAAKKQ